MFNDLSSPLSLLATRRSGKARDMVAPGPDEAQLRQILSIATRTPDHGKLAPWRFVIIAQHQRDALAAALRSAYLADKPEAGRIEIEAVEAFAREAPVLVVALSCPVAGKTPLWEQELSAGAACMNLLMAAHATGFVASWLTGWAAFSDRVRDLFGPPNCRIAGFIFIGTPSRPLDERPRPAFDSIVSTWTVPAA